MPTTSAYELIAAALKDVIDVEFAPEGVIAVHDKIHESLGSKRRECGIAPLDDSVPMNNGLVLATLAEVRFYDLWRREITPTTAVDPRIIANYAERFRRAVNAHRPQDPRSGVLWYLDVRRVKYLDDPTGNCSRFVAEVRGFGNNSSLVETSG